MIRVTKNQRLFSMRRRQRDKTPRKPSPPNIGVSQNAPRRCEGADAPAPSLGRPLRARDSVRWLLLKSVKHQHNHLSTTWQSIKWTLVFSAWCSSEVKQEVSGSSSCKQMARQPVNKGKMNIKNFSAGRGSLGGHMVRCRTACMSV